MSSPLYPQIAGIAGGGGLLLIVLTLLIAFFLVIRRRKNNNDNYNKNQNENNDTPLTNSPAKDAEMGSMANCKSNNSSPSTPQLPASFSPTSSPKAKAINIPSDLAKMSNKIPELTGVKLQRKLGGGNFGEVFYGVWNGTPVACKKLKTEEEFKEFIAEADLLL